MAKVAEWFRNVSDHHAAPAAARHLGGRGVSCQAAFRPVAAGASAGRPRPSDLARLDRFSL